MIITRYVLWASMMMLFCSFGHAQTRTQFALTGAVTDSRGAALSGASVALHERDGRTRFSTVTDQAGRYSFERLASGEYLIRVDAEGFTPAVRPFSLRHDESRTLDISLEVEGLSAEVVVTASGTAQQIDEVSKAVTIISADEIERRAENSLVEALRTVPGLRIQQQGGPGTFTAIKIRGLRNRDTALLIDGLRYRDATSPEGDATSLYEDVLVTNIERVEVLRGSGSSLYGTNAIGGVVNLITDEGGGPAHGQVQLEGGSLGLFRARAQVAGGTQSDRFRYSAGIAHLNVARGVDGNDAARKTNGQAFVQFNFTPQLSLTGRLFGVDSFLQLNGIVVPTTNLPASSEVTAIALSREKQRLLEAGTPVSAIDPSSSTYIPALDDPDDRRTARAFSGALTLAHRLNESAGYRISFQRLVTDRTVRRGPGGVEYPSLFIFQPTYTATSNFDGVIDTLNARADFRTGRRNLITAGYEYERESFDDLSQDENPAPSARLRTLTSIVQSSQTLFVQDQIRLFDDRLQMSAAGRMQRFSLDRPRFEGGTPAYQGIAFDAPPTAYTADGSISYFFDRTETKLRAHVGNGYRAPSLYGRFSTFFSSFSGAVFNAQGDPRLRPERSVAFDAGVDQSLARGRLRASATYFYTRLQEVIDFGSLPPTDPFGRSFGYINTGGGLARGAELSLTAQPTRTLELSASYTYTNSDQRRATVANFLRSFGISDHIFTFYANQRLGRRVDLTFDLYAASSYAFPLFTNTGTRAFIFDGPVKADLGFSYTIPLEDDRRHVRFYGKIGNIFDHTYHENGFRAPGANFTGGLSLRF